MAYKKLKYWFDRELALMLSKKLEKVYSEFESNSFTQRIVEKLEGLELKDRVDVFATEIHHHLGPTYVQNIDLLKQILGPENHKESGMFKDYYWIMPIAKYVEKYGLEHFDASMKMLEEITKRNTAEYAIRPFLEMYPDKTMKTMLKWSTNSNKHIRRLSSEGCRPRLPWASKLQRFIDNPNPILPVLDNLKDDNSKYVQKSVANSLNDILKDNLEIGKNMVQKWRHGKMTTERKWIIKHALRNLLKKEDPWAQRMID